MRFHFLHSESRQVSNTVSATACAITSSLYCWIVVPIAPSMIMMRCTCTKSFRTLSHGSSRMFSPTGATTQRQMLGLRSEYLGQSLSEEFFDIVLDRAPALKDPVVLQ